MFCILACLFIDLGFNVDISQITMGSLQAEETSSVNCQPLLSNYQLSQIGSGFEPQTSEVVFKFQLTRFIFMKLDEHNLHCKCY